MYGSCRGQATPRKSVLLHAHIESRTRSGHKNCGRFAEIALLVAVAVVMIFFNMEYITILINSVPTITRFAEIAP